MRRTLLVGALVLGATTIMPAAQAAISCDDVVGAVTFCRGHQDDPAGNTVAIIDVKVNPVQGQVHVGQIRFADGTTWTGAGVCALGVTCAGTPVLTEVPLLPPFPL